MDQPDEPTLAELQKQADALQEAIAGKKAKEQVRSNGFGACPTETVSRNGVECDINVGDFNPKTDEKIGSKKVKAKPSPLFDILDGSIKEVIAELDKVDSIENLDLLAEAEKKGKTRDKVVKAIEDRKEKLIEG